MEAAPAGDDGISGEPLSPREERPGWRRAPHYRAGSREDFDRLYRDSHSKVVATLVGLLGDPAAAEDCAQEAFVRAFQAWGRWRPDAPAEAWLHRIAFNVATSHLRRRRLLTVREHIRRLGAPTLAPDPSEFSHHELLRALRRLPPKQAAAVVLRHFHGYTNREISTALGVPERTVASRLAAGKERLRSQLRWDDDDAAGSGPGWQTERIDDTGDGAGMGSEKGPERVARPMGTSPAGGVVGVHSAGAKEMT